MPAAPFEPFFLPVDGANPGFRFCIYHPAQGQAVRGAIVYIHPFAEEMNKSRRMAALQSREFAKAGYAVLQMDLLGCGDSSGDFGDATWDDWVADVQRSANWLARRTSAPLWLWGLRAGCLLAVDAARSMPTTPNLLFWSPTVSGKQVLQQFLRLKVAAELAGGNAKGILDTLRADLAEGRPVEIAGYRMSSRLASGLNKTSLEAIATEPADRRRLEWIELSTQDAAQPSPVAVEALSTWAQAGWSGARGQVVRGPAFWQTTEIEDAPELVDASLAIMNTWNHGHEGQDRSSYAAGELKEVLGSDQAATFDCDGETLLGVISFPERPASRTGVVVIVGGPQYRAGSHRQFVLLARAVAAAGYPVLRFDYRGMGDSTGEMRDFQQVTPDIAAAIDTLLRRMPTVRQVVLWGLCDAASAALLYRYDTQDARVRGLCLLNPWVRSDASLAKTQVKHYYTQRLRQKEFWAKLFSGRIARSALTGLARNLATAFSARAKADATENDKPFQDRMADSWQRFDAPALLFLSGNDYTAKEFCEYVNASPSWANTLTNPHLVRHEEAEADHTLSHQKPRLAVEKSTIELVRRVDAFAANAIP